MHFIKILPLKSHLIWAVVYLNPRLLNSVYLVGERTNSPTLHLRTPAILSCGSTVQCGSKGRTCQFYSKLRSDLITKRHAKPFFLEILISIHSMCKKQHSPKGKKKKKIELWFLLPSFQNVRDWCLTTKMGPGTSLSSQLAFQMY